MVEVLQQSGAVGDNFQRLTSILGLSGRYAIVDGTIVFDSNAVRVVYLPDSIAPTAAAIGVPYKVQEGFSIEHNPDPKSRYLLHGFWVKNDVAGQVATAIAQGLVEPVG